MGTIARAPKRGRVTKAAAEDDAFNVNAEAAGIEASRSEILKATTYSGRRPSHVIPHADEADKFFTGIGAIDPPYNPATLLVLLEHSSSLRQCIDAYVTNIDAFGHRFEPIIDLDGADANARLKSYMIERRQAADPATVADPTKQIAEPTDDEIDAAKLELREKMRAERTRLEHFFDYACLDQSFVSLRRQARQDLEQQGNAYWEVIRDESGVIAGFSYVPAFTMRHMKSRHEHTQVSYRVKSNEFDYTTVTQHKHFRVFVQCFEQRVVYFKEFGDPSVVSASTGMTYPSHDAMVAQEKERASRASEIIHFRIHTPKSSYGIPRWVGTLLSVLGSRQAEEVNLTYFENKSVPPLAILVQGGRMSNDSVDRIKDFVENEIKGKKNFHKILVLEAEGPGAGSFDQGRMKIDLKPLTGAQHNDALFQNYDERNMDKVGMAFRLPRMLRGDIRDFNRATADAAVEFAESQVFKPERDDFDFTMNRKILPSLGIRFWRFKSNGASTQNPTELTEIASKLGTVGFLTPAEGRDLAGVILNRTLAKIDAPWVKQPLELTLKGIAPPGDIAAPGMVTPQAAAQGGAPGDAPLGGAPMNDANAPAAPTGPTGDTSGVKLTGTDLAAIVTVNEARSNVGLGNLKLQDQTDDPDGFLTVAEFKAKKLASGTVTGQSEGASEDGTAPAPDQQKDDGGGGTMTTGSLAGGGLALPSQGAGRKRPKKTENDALLGFATQLLSLRKAMAFLEAADARAQFEEAAKAARDVEEDEDDLG